MAGTSGDGSYQKLITNNYGIDKSKTGVFAINYKEYNIAIRPDTILIQQIFFINRAGYYFDSLLNHRNNYMMIWLSKPSDRKEKASGVHSHTTYLFLNLFDETKVAGFSVRCVAKSHFSLDFYAYL